MTSVFIFSKPVDSLQLGCWAEKVGNFKSVIGYTVWGDFFLQNQNTNKIAVLYAIDPELVPIDFDSIEKFKSEFLIAPEVQQHLIRPELFAEVEKRLGALEVGEVFIPEPYPFLGGSCAPETYVKGSVWTFIDLVGQMQGIGDDI